MLVLAAAVSQRHAWPPDSVALRLRLAVHHHVTASTSLDTRTPACEPQPVYLPHLTGVPTQACYGRSGRQRSAAQLYGDVGSVLLVRGQAEVAAELMEHVAALAQAEGWWVTGWLSVWLVCCTGSRLVDRLLSVLVHVLRDKEPYPLHNYDVPSQYRSHTAAGPRDAHRSRLPCHVFTRPNPCCYPTPPSCAGRCCWVARCRCCWRRSRRSVTS